VPDPVLPPASALSPVPVLPPVSALPQPNVTRSACGRSAPCTRGRPARWALQLTRALSAAVRGRLPCDPGHERDDDRTSRRRSVAQKRRAPRPLGRIGQRRDVTQGLRPTPNPALPADLRADSPLRWRGSRPREGAGRALQRCLGAGPRIVRCVVRGAARRRPGPVAQQPGERAVGSGPVLLIDRLDERRHRHAARRPRSR
jgi:hypothetical protein